MLKKIIITSVLLAQSHIVVASNDFSECKQLFVQGQLPQIPKQEELKPRALCFSAFAVLHSGRSRTPVYVAEKLNKQSLLEARENKRTNRFFSDARLPRAERSELDDYQVSGFDRGHMAPAADMPTPEAMAQSFSLANMVPQAPQNNRKTWAAIEKATRKYVMRAQGDVYVLTGPVFEARPESLGPNKVWIPKHLFKLVYDPSAKRSWAYWVENADDAVAGKPITYAELVQRTGFNLIPALKN